MNLHITHSTTLYCRKGLETQLNQVSHRGMRVLNPNKGLFMPGQLNTTQHVY